MIQSTRFFLFQVMNFIRMSPNMNMTFHLGMTEITAFAHWRLIKKYLPYVSVKYFWNFNFKLIDLFYAFITQFSTFSTFFSCMFPECQQWNFSLLLLILIFWKVLKRMIEINILLMTTTIRFFALLMMSAISKWFAFSIFVIRLL